MEKINDEIIEAMKKYVKFDNSDLKIEMHKMEKESEQTISISLTRSY